jgi:hypothetical protein
MPTPLPQRVPENAPGDFYVQADLCTQCCLPHGEAPELLNDPKQFFKECYFRRQPQTPAEIDRAIAAISVSEMCALRYAGSDPEILGKLRARNLAAQCDQTPEGRAWLETIANPTPPSPDAPRVAPSQPLAYFSPAPDQTRSSESERLVRSLLWARRIAGWLTVVTFVFVGLFHPSDSDPLHGPAVFAFVTSLAVSACIGLALWVMEFREPRQAPSRRD